MVDKIRDLCKENGITIAELERRCGIGNGIIARWKKSKPSYDRLALVAKELGVSVEELTGQKEKPSPVSEEGPKPPKEYEFLTPENRALVDQMIRQLAAGKE